MLGKLMKYEFRSVGRIMLPLYGAWLVISLLFGLVINKLQELTLINVITGLLYGAVTAVALVLTLILIIQRFYKNLLGQEGYLMFTLPVTTGRHIWNKTISAAVWFVLAGIVALVSVGFISIWSVTPSAILKGIGMFFSDVSHSVGAGGTVLLTIEVIALVLLIGGEAALKIYAAIAIGHQWSSHRIIGAVGAYIGLSILEVIVINIVFWIRNFTPPSFNDFMDSLIPSQQFAAAQIMIGILALIAAIPAAVYYIVTYKLLDTRLNLE